MKLHLLRHAKTEVNSVSGKDFDRALMNKGIIQANLMGQYLRNRSIKNHDTYCSDAMRTRQTLTIISQLIDCKKINFKNELYLADREILLALLWRIKHKKDLLIIGHNDGLSQFASYLTDLPVHLKTCGYLCIEFQADSWKETSMGTGTIVDDYRPQVYFPD